MPVSSQPTTESNATATGESKETVTVAPPRRRIDPGLLLIGLFKLAKAALFFSIGIGAIHLLHKLRAGDIDLGEMVTNLAKALKFDEESRFVKLLLDKVDLIDAHRLREIGAATFAYSALALTEGVGLVLEKVWAEYLTLTLTVSFLPWEIYELARHPNLFRLSILVINLMVVGYLVWLLRRKAGKRCECTLRGVACNHKKHRVARHNSGRESN